MASKGKKQVGSVCLYGANHCGYGWLASVGSQMYGNGELLSASLTSAMWHGLLDLKEAGHSGVVGVYAPGGERKAMVDLAKPLPYYGELKWQPAEVYEIPAEEIIKYGVEVEVKGGVS